MNYIVMDLEWNQCPSGKENQIAEIPFEIFEIGAVKLNEDRQIMDRFSCYIKPQVYRELHYIAKGLTHISMDKLDEGSVFPDAAEAFLKWCGDEGSYRICTWGSADLVEFQRNMRFYKMGRPFGFPLFYYDVQKLFSLSSEDGKMRRSLEAAVDMLEIEKNEGFHTAICDAVYTARIMQSIDFPAVRRFYSIDTYYIPENQKSEIKVNYGTYLKYITMGCDTREELIKNPRLLSTKCYVCGRAARKKIRWFTVNSKTHYCLAECKEHGWLKGRFRIKEDDFGKFYAVKILKLTDERGAGEIRGKQAEIRRRRRERRERSSEK